MNAPQIHKLLIGKVKQLGDPDSSNRLDKPWESGMFKKEVEGKCWLSFTGLENDEVADTKNHGGPEKALFAYPINHYSFWQKRLNTDEMGIGAMGENLAINEADEFSICIGDTFEIDDAVIQVSQPRQPCWKPARRFRVMDLALQIQNSGRTGWYFRVLKEGFISNGSSLKLVERSYPQWTIAACNEVMHIYKDDLRQADELASCSLLAPNWKRTLHKRLRGQQSSVGKRIFGPNKEI
ncbi:MOSC domain-containing protein [Virgibacillus necropolis]|uniref:MOSC domain-containing protein n=1 Tax=Virgibacillus necropolis TaxID=163877 RepID=A0A221MH92_9BACI|nr:MOSC domain-containing protein [Virgibacillus necropolis]ASN07016.1 MOSC domain-containing protein [Virgibacillus necropolis]